MTPTPKKRTQGQRPRDDSWKTTFLESLSVMPNVSAAARAAGIDPTTAYDHRKTDAEFAKAWNAGLDQGFDLLEQEAVRRATVGGKVTRTMTRTLPTGEVVIETSEETKTSDTLLIFLLKAYRPERFRERYDVDHKVGGLNGEPLTIRLAFDPTPSEPTLETGALTVKLGELGPGSNGA